MTDEVDELKNIFNDFKILAAQRLTMIIRIKKT